MKDRVPALSILTCFGVYLVTLCPTVYLGDSGELSAAAFCLGIPHNSGYPLYALLGKLFCLMPLGNIGFRMNLMSAFFAVMALWLVYGLILKVTASRTAAFSGTFTLAFVPLFWMQTVSAEVYGLHLFFLAALIRLLWAWDQDRSLWRLLLLAFTAGLSFCNHLQTVMLAPAVFFILITREGRSLLDLRRLLLVTLFFALPLLLYLYLPLRTDAGAPITWGDPNTLDRFVAHVTARVHRGEYVLTKSPLEYLLRAKEVLWLLSLQFGAGLLFSLWGWLRFPSVRWRVFFLLMMCFDMVYTVFLNIISLEITAFSVPTCLALAILAGTGLGRALEAVRTRAAIGRGTRRAVTAALCLIPVLFLAAHFGRCCQARNYTAYEQAVNIFRTSPPGSVLIVDGDNYVFPLVYGRLVEGMGAGVDIYDQYNLVFKWPLLDTKGRFLDEGDPSKAVIEERVIQEHVPDGVYLALFDPHTVSLPRDCTSVPYGILRRVVRKGTPNDLEASGSLWRRYSRESFYAAFERDYMTRQVCAYFHFALGKFQFLSGSPEEGLRSLRTASRMAFNDTMIHSDIAVFLTERGLFEDAREELLKALTYHEDLSTILNNWAYYHHRRHEYDAAIGFLRRATELAPKNPVFQNNLGFLLDQAGRRDEALTAFRRSLAINPRQPRIQEIIGERATPP